MHIDHGLHPDSADWAAHCQHICAALQLPLHIERAQVQGHAGRSLEEAARTARWSLWEQRLAVNEQLWLAHHQDDQAETLLLALLRGSGLDGLAAMPVRRPLGAGEVVRPLLEVSASALADYAAAAALHWVEDPSNTNTAFDRNYLRHQVLPVLRQRWPAASATIARSAAHCAAAIGVLDPIVAGWITEARGQAAGTLSVRALSALEPQPRQAVLRAWLKHAGFRPPGQRRLAQVSHTLLRARADACPQVKWEGCELRRYRDDLFALAPLPPPPTPGIHWQWDGRQPLALGAGLGVLSVSEPAVRTSWQVGFGLSGLRARPRPDGPSRSLKAVFQSQGVPAWMRPYVPLVLLDGQLVAIAGVCLCASSGASTPNGLSWQQPFGAKFGLKDTLGATAAQ
jgi:tRNA(Ile)-lysidine synthase